MSSVSTPASDSLSRLQLRLQKMPPVRAMALRVDDFDPATGLALSAPLSANINDKGCAFGGSLCSMMTLASWGSASLALDLAGFPEAEVYVQDSTVRYLAPLYDDLHARARLEDGHDWAEFVRTYRNRGKARANLCAEIHCADGRLASSFVGRFVALRPQA
ncbi:YiiD C-terminal domain-containing protein [Pseudomarimonas salicorniae]|uniref:Thioesterase domain-containing protein n=1 Tax=Pseudomarimonas salicorniae TaxID=2933270 RepID=A0ABT0GGB8_9GAMM|nr:YiiD C-terminal domain-containing protein [Lysobacter sp. CAU 1642]MCK7593588.1 thioesterase domain-containing protein [Lysobacter sp. CAU 1642]